MKKENIYYVVLDTGYVGVDVRFEFTAYEGAEPEDLQRLAESVLTSNLEWHVEDEEGNEI